MPGTLRYSLAAENDLLGIHAYFAERNPQAATRLLLRIDQKCRLLADMPGLGARRDQLRECMRLWTEGADLILYRIETAGILVVRVIHGRRDLKQIFSPDQTT